MSIQEEMEILRRLPFFAKVEPAKLKLLAFTSERLTFEAGQILFHQGEDADAAYVILDGKADVLAETPKGPVQLAQVDRHSIIGEVAILCGVPRTATIRAATKLLTLRIRKRQFLELLEQFPEMSIEVMRELALRLSRTSSELTEARSRLREMGA